MNYTWLTSSAHADLPPNPVNAGYDVDGSPIFVGRAHHEGDLLPAKVIPSKHIAYVSHSGWEFPKYQFEVLSGPLHSFTWTTSSNGQVPPGAVVAGSTVQGEPLYVGRACYDGSLTPGKIHPSHRCLYIPYGGVEQSIPNYDVLISSGCTWLTSSAHADLPPNPVYVGNDSDGSPIFVGRAHHEGDLLPAKVIPSKHIAYVSHSGLEFPKHQFEILSGPLHCFTWTASSNGHVPPSAIEAGSTVQGERLYVGRACYDGSLTPGKIHPSHGCLYIPYGGVERSIPNYEVLIRRYESLEATGPEDDVVDNVAELFSRECQVEAESDNRSASSPSQSQRVSSTPPRHKTTACDLDPCSICLEDFLPSQALRFLPCAHKFHSKCFEDWRRLGNGSCPVCRG